MIGKYTQATAIVPRASLSHIEDFHQYKGIRALENGAPKLIPIMNATDVKCSFVLSYAFSTSFLRPGHAFYSVNVNGHKSYIEILNPLGWDKCIVLHDCCKGQAK